MSKNKRFFKHYYIYPKFQRQFLSIIIFMVMTACTLYYAVIWYFFTSFYNKGSESGIPADHVYFKFLDNLAAEMNLMMLIGTLILVGLFLMIGVIVSHKIAGPLVRMQSEFTRMKESDKIHPIVFRQGDYFQDITVPFNEMAQKWKEK